MIRNAEHTQAAGAEQLVTVHIVRLHRRVEMHRAVELDREGEFTAEEVENEPAKRHLASELEAKTTPIAEHLPKSPFGGS